MRSECVSNVPFVKGGLERIFTSNVHRHLFDLSAVELFDFSHHADVIGSDEVDSNTLSAKTTTTANAVDVVLAVCREIIVDDQRDLLNVNTTGQEISGNEHTRRSGSELFHDNIALSLLHVAMHGGYGEVSSSELVSQPVNLSSSVTEDDSLCDGNGLVEIREGVQFPLLLFHSNVKLFDAFESQFSLFDKDTDRVAHEFSGDFEDILWHGGGKEDNLSGLRKKLEDIVDLFGESTLEAELEIDFRAIWNFYVPRAFRQPRPR